MLNLFQFWTDVDHIQASQDALDRRISLISKPSIVNRFVVSRQLLYWFELKLNHSKIFVNDIIINHTSYSNTKVTLWGKAKLLRKMKAISQMPHLLIQSKIRWNVQATSIKLNITIAPVNWVTFLPSLHISKRWLRILLACYGSILENISFITNAIHPQLVPTVPEARFNDGYENRLVWWEKK